MNDAKTHPPILSELLFFLSFLLFGIIGGLYIIGFVLLVLRLSFSPIFIVPPIFLLLNLLFVFALYWSKRNLGKGRYGVLLFTAALFLLLISYVISKNVYDITYDGQWYHQEAVIQLKEGWNPFSEKLQPDEFPYIKNLAVNYYPKATWITNAVIYGLTGEIEGAKMINLLILLCSFFLVWGALLRFFKGKSLLALLVATPLALNPFTLYLLLSFYVDGLLMSLLLSTWALLYALNHKQSFHVLLMLFIATIILLNVKFTAIPYLGITYATFLLLQILLKKAVVIVLKNALFLGISSLIAMFIFGYVPYVTNFIEHKDLFYPVTDEQFEEVGFAKQQKYRKKSVMEGLFLLTFTEADNWEDEAEEIKLKLPFVIKPHELKAFPPNPYYGSFGPLFSGIVVLAAAGFIFFGILFAFADLKSLICALIITIAILFSVLVNAECWWARFVPQYFFIFVPFLLLSLSGKLRFPRYYAYIALLILYLNLGIILNGYIINTGDTVVQLKEQLSKMSEFAEEKEIRVDFKEFTSNRIRLQEKEIKFKEVNSSLCEEKENIVASEAVWCREK